MAIGKYIWRSTEMRQRGLSIEEEIIVSFFSWLWRGLPASQDMRDSLRYGGSVVRFYMVVIFLIWGGMIFNAPWMDLGQQFFCVAAVHVMLTFIQMCLLSREVTVVEWFRLMSGKFSEEHQEKFDELERELLVLFPMDFMGPYFCWRYPGKAGINSPIASVNSSEGQLLKTISLNPPDCLYRGAKFLRSFTLWVPGIHFVLLFLQGFAHGMYSGYFNAFGVIFFPVAGWIFIFSINSILGLRSHFWRLNARLAGKKAREEFFSGDDAWRIERVRQFLIERHEVENRIVALRKDYQDYLKDATARDPQIEGLEERYLGIQKKIALINPSQSVMWNYIEAEVKKKAEIPWEIGAALEKHFW